MDAPATAPTVEGFHAVASLPSTAFDAPEPPSSCELLSTSVGVSPHSPPSPAATMVHRWPRLLCVVAIAMASPTRHPILSAECCSISWDVPASAVRASSVQVRASLRP